jgi:hypothetical protein
MNDGTTFNNKLDEIINLAGGRLYLAHLDRPALERFVRLMLADIEKDINSWRYSKDGSRYEPYWDGYEQGCSDSILAVRLWGQDIN